MDIIEFIASMHSLSRENSWMARDKVDLACKFGLNSAPKLVPFDINQTFISDRALDGYFAREILSNGSIDISSSSDYAFTVAAIFSAQQTLIRNSESTGFQSRKLDSSHTSFIFKSLDECLWRTAVALKQIPFVYNWWLPEFECNAVSVDSSIDNYIKIFRERNSRKIEQRICAFNCTNKKGIISRQIQSNDPELTCAQTDMSGEIAVLLLYKLGNVDDYLMLLDRIQNRLSRQATLIVYDKQEIVANCMNKLLLKHSWRSCILKVLEYYNSIGDPTKSICALQSNYLPDTLRGHMRIESV